MAAGQFLTGQVGGQPIGNANSFVELATAYTGYGYKPLVRLGQIQSVIYPGFGGMEVIRLSFNNAQNSMPVGSVCVWDSVFNVSPCPATANTGTPVAISIMPLTYNVNYYQYAWFALSGTHPVLTASSIAVGGEIGISATVAGKADTNSAGRQILGCVVRTADTATVVKNASLRGGSATIIVDNTNGWFVGLPISGTGIPGSTTISSIEADDHRVVMSAAATTTGDVSVTATYNNASTTRWPTCAFSRPHVQGEIT